MNLEDDMLRGYIDYILRRYRAGLPLIPDTGGSVSHYPSPNPTFMPYPYGMVNTPHILHHVASHAPPPMSASPAANQGNMNNTSHTNVSGDDHATPCTPTSNLRPSLSDFHYSWT